MRCSFNHSSKIGQEFSVSATPMPLSIVSNLGGHWFVCDNYDHEKITDGYRHADHMQPLWRIYDYFCLQKCGREVRSGASPHSAIIIIIIIVIIIIIIIILIQSLRTFFSWHNMYRQLSGYSTLQHPWNVWQRLLLFNSEDKFE